MATTDKFLGFILPGGVVPGQISITDGIRLRVSVCVYINKDYIGLDADHQTTDDSYDTFYGGLQKLRNTRFSAPVIAGQMTANPKTLSLFGNIAPDVVATDTDQLKTMLWNVVFPSDRKTNPISSPPQIYPGPIDSLFGKDHENLEPLRDFLSGAGNSKDFKAASILTQIHRYGHTQMKVAYEKNIAFLANSKSGRAFVSRWAPLLSGMESKLAANKLSESEFAAQAGNFYDELLKLRKDAIQSYLGTDTNHDVTQKLVKGSRTPIDIDEVINNYNAVSREPVLMKIMGLIQEFEITVPFNILPTADQRASVTLTSGDADIAGLVSFFKTRLQICNQNNKYAFLVENTISDSECTFYDQSILLNSPTINHVVHLGVMSIIRADKMALTQKLADRQKKLAETGAIANDDLGDALTRGLLLVHPYLDQVIAPPEFTDSVLNAGLTDDFVTRGHRVGLYMTQGRNTNLYSLTKRDMSLKVAKKNGTKIIYDSPDNEGCISFDTPSQYSKDGQVQSSTSDTVLEYSGELLTLKSAFSMANKTTRADQAVQQLRNSHDSGLFKSMARFEQPVNAEGIIYDKAISFHHFPFNEVSEKTSYVSVFYDIPRTFTRGHTPQLRFGNSYTMVVFQEYLNGWGLPLKKQDSVAFQLSIEELVANSPDKYIPASKTFEPLERKKAPDMFYRFGVSKELTDSISLKPSLYDFVVRSDNDNTQYPLRDDRHILPPKIDIEPAFWRNMLSPDIMSTIDSFNLKRRSNCKFVDQSGYNDYTAELDENNKNRKCPEGCDVYCGGTHMADHYDSDNINPRYLCDPSINGASVNFFYDKGCSAQLRVISIGKQRFTYGGDIGFAPQSVLLRASGAKYDSFIAPHPHDAVLELCLKRGATLYAQIANSINDEGMAALANGWWTDYNAALSLTDQSVINNSKNVPRLVTFTHAVREPLFVPKLLQMASVPPDPRQVNHILPYLNDDSYRNYHLWVNVIGERAKNPATGLSINSNIAVMYLKAQFERLDAVALNTFLQDVIPTGGLELWMRKESFVDNPEQTVLPDGSPLNHQPADPILSFNDDLNQFKMEFRIEFSADVLKQLKVIGNNPFDPAIQDVFRAVTSSLRLEYDFKSNIFEERQYYLKNISKFRGYFDDQTFDSTDSDAANAHLETFVQPKLAKVTSNEQLKFKVMSLNNAVLNVPSVAYAVTTIRETRNDYFPDGADSTQVGDMVTIYLNRGRLKSGKDERLGIIIESQSDYNELFKSNDLISKGGRDILTDRYDSATIYIKQNQITAPPEYKGAFDPALGIYHVLPIFDPETQLWKAEIQLTITTNLGKRLHNPFVNFSLVHFQPFSINYNQKGNLSTFEDLKNDCRISGVERTTWCYLLPKRALSVTFKKADIFHLFKGSLEFTLTFDWESIHQFYYQDKSPSPDQNYMIRSNFILTIEGSDDHGVKWTKLHSSRQDLDLAASSKKKGGPQYHHALLTPAAIAIKKGVISDKLYFSRFANPYDQNSVSFSKFRVRIVEVEWFEHEDWSGLLLKYPELQNADPQHAEQLRIRYVELFY
jgi:hypothetical protein